MPSFPFPAFLTGLALSVLAVVLLMAVTFAVATVQRRHSVIDVTWGLGFVVIAAVTFLASAGVAGADPGRRLLMLVLVAVWGVRLAAFIGWRARGGEEDPRYTAMLADPQGSAALLALRKVYLPQAGVMLFVSLPLQVAMVSTGPLGIVAGAGALVWAAGLAFEAIGDHQLSAFRNDPARRGTVLYTGLWRYTRHPNYFGDALVWAGLFLVAADSWPGILTVLSPALMIWALAGKTGKPLTEQRMSGRPGYKEYMERTSGFLPLPPRAGRGI